MMGVGPGLILPSGNTMSLEMSKYSKRDSSKVIPVSVMSGGITCYRREVFDEFSFDEHLKGYSYNEDLDFSYRVSQKYRLLFNPFARVSHRASFGGMGVRITPEFPVYSEKRFQCFVRNTHFIFKKNMPQKILNWIAYLWSNIGLCIYYLSIRKFKPLKGIILGYWDIICKRGPC